ncbi:MAG: hypothetical protein KC416_01415 [Myxococcales bacterium]|nr:hypothetical protein [Myxococcales bacterium]
MRLHIHRTLLLSLVLLGGLWGCKVSNDDIETWKGTIKGPGKIVAVILSPKYPLELRSQAALALVEMERPDVEGPKKLHQTMQHLDPETRTKVLAAIVPGLEALMRGGQSAQSDGTATGPTEQQWRAKDAAYLLTKVATGETRQKLIDSIIAWYRVDFNGRNLAGDFSAEQIVAELGSGAAGTLVDALNAKMPGPALVKLTELINSKGDAAAKKKAAERMVAIQDEMTGEKFLAWLMSLVRTQLKDAGQEADDARVKRIAEYNRESYMAGIIAAMKPLAREKAVSDRLLSIAADPKQTEDRRRAALQALEGKATEKQLDTLLALALGEGNPTSVRDYAFDRVGDVASKRAIPHLWPLVQSSTEQRLRWRASELVLAIGGPEVLSQFLTRLPAKAEFEPAELNGYATRMSDMTGDTPRRTALQKLGSGQWWEKVIALRYLEKKGKKDDVARMKKLTTDKAPTQGKQWDGQGLKTVGDVAEDAVKAIEARLSSGEEQSQG